jgi:hypothetical protein
MLWVPAALLCSYVCAAHCAQNEVPDNWLKSSRRAYVADWDNQAWAANLMLAELTHAQVYRERVRELLGIWLYGDAVPSVRVIYESKSRADETQCQSRC